MFHLATPHASSGRPGLEFARKACSFVGPGFLISVAYIDPGNYATDIAAGATYRFRLLFVVLLANIFAIFLQSLAIKLGTVSGLDLAQACRAFLPAWLNYLLYFFAEVAIIATDVAEVIGFAIALNLLVPQIPLVAGCAISILDVMLILLFYRPDKSMNGLRVFELFVASLVLGVVVCFAIELSLITGTTAGEVFQGYLPSGALIEQQGLYQACGILGATVMPHSLYLGSGIVQPRLREYDMRNKASLPLAPSSQVQETSPATSRAATPAEHDTDIDDHDDKTHYTPSLAAIRHCLTASTIELGVALFGFALFVNSAILIVAGAALSDIDDADTADIFTIHALLAQTISRGAATVFALALLLSGVSAGIVCTIAGQMVSEGALRWSIRRPWLRRLATRSLSITPSIIIAGAVGREGLSTALTASQVCLSVVLPFVTAPLIWFTCRAGYMTVHVQDPGRGGTADRVVEGSGSSSGGGCGVVAGAGGEQGISTETGAVSMANSWYTAVLAGVVWLAITVLNVANLVLLARGS